MDKKKVIGIVVFIALGLFIFTFANPGPSTLDPVEVPSQEDKEPDEDKQPEEDKEEETDGETVGNIEDEEETAVDYYQLALEAIKKAEESLLQNDVDSAKDLINNVSGQQKEELVDRVENVQNVIDYNKLLTELENKTNSSTNKDELNGARDYNTTTDLANKLASLNDDANKEKLLNRYNVLLPKLNDTTAPVVTGLDKEYTNQIVKLTITDDSSFSASLNSENYITGTEITEDGKYTLVAIDASFNETIVTFIIDTAAPEITVKEESIGSIDKDIYSNVSFKLYDEYLVVKAVLNGVEKPLTPSTWSDFNNITVGKDGAIYGENTLVLYDVAGNSVEYKFTLDNKVPQLDPESWTVTLEVDRNTTFICPDMTQYGKDEYGVAKVELDQYYNDNLTNVDITKPGKFVCRYITTDNAGNKASNDIFYTVVDTTAPKTNAANILVNGDANEQKVFYATYGDKIYAYVRFNEELKSIPTFTLINNGNEYVIDEKDVTVRKFDDGQYQYSMYYEITSDTAMTDGEITMRISNIEDLYGNKASDIVKPTNGHVVYLDTTPANRVYSTVDFDGTGIVPKVDGTRKTYYINNGKSFVFRMQFTEQLLENPILNVGNKKVELELIEKFVTEEGKYIYQGEVEITEEDKFEDGSLSLVLSNVKDLAGNETTDMNILNQTVTSNDRTIVIDNTNVNAKPLYILARDDANYRLSISDGEYLRVEANFDEELKELPILTVGSQSMEFDRCKFNSTNNLYVCVADMKIDNEIAKLVEGEVIPFEVTNVKDLAGNEISFDNSNVTKYYQNGKLVYDQVKYENPFVSMTFHNSTNYKLNEENNNNNLSLTEAKIGDSVRVFVRFNQDLAIDNFKPVIVIGGVSKELKLSNVYNDGTKDYGTDVIITDEMNLEPNKEISFVIKNIVLENGNTLPNLTQDNITSNILSGVTYIED